jgi:hypothetical protein
LPKEDASTSAGTAQTGAGPTQQGGMGAATVADFKTALPLKEIMAHMVDYNAFGVWNRQGWLIDVDGIHEQFPTTEAEWLAAESAAISLAETSNVLLLPGRPQDEDRRWVDFAHALYDAAMKAHDTAEKASEVMLKGTPEEFTKAKQAFFDAGGDMYEACLQCHNHYIVGGPGPTVTLPALPNRVKPEDANKPK